MVGHYTILLDIEERAWRNNGKLKQMRDGLHRIVLEVRGGAAAISTVTEEISLDSADLSQRTESQASSLQETAASMETLTSAVKASSATAYAARLAAIQASDAAQSGGRVMAELRQFPGTR